MVTAIEVSLPSVADVGTNVYHRAYLARRRANLLLDKAAEQGVDISVLRLPQSWEDLDLFVRALKALLRSERDSAKFRQDYAARKQRRAAEGLAAVK